MQASAGVCACVAYIYTHTATHTHTHTHPIGTYVIHEYAWQNFGTIKNNLMEVVHYEKKDWNVVGATDQ